MKRGFTLLEVSVSIVLMAIVLGTAMAIMATVLSDNRRARVHSEMLREGNYVSTLMNSELRQAGLGVPAAFNSSCNPDGTNIRRDCALSPCSPRYGSVRPARFYGSVLVAAPDQVGILGDLPRPDGQYSAYGPLHNRNTAHPLINTGEYIMWHNENNGSCAPGSGVVNCQLDRTSQFFQDGTEVCASGSPNARTCPWGMRRVLPGERIQIVAGDSTWAHAAATNIVDNIDPADADRAALRLNPGFDLNPADANYATEALWENSLPGDGPGGIRGQGWVTTLDRIFFFRDPATNTIQRIQCFGDPDPDAAGWPNAGAAAIPGVPGVGSLTITPANSGLNVAANTCVGPDIVARNVSSLTFTYNNATASMGNSVVNVTAPTCAPGFTAPTTGKSAIRRIDYSIQFRKTVPGSPPRDVTHTVRGSIRLQNL